jgi:hypothetical protein
METIYVYDADKKLHESVPIYTLKEYLEEVVDVEDFRHAYSLLDIKDCKEVVCFPENDVLIMSDDKYRIYVAARADANQYVEFDMFSDVVKYIRTSGDEFRTVKRVTIWTNC